MAKRKLTEKRRLALRKDIARKLKKGESQGSILRHIAWKYQISPETVRWYLKGRNGGATHRKSDSGKTPTASSPSNGHHPRMAGAGHDLRNLITELSDWKLHRLLKARKLIPELKAYRNRQVELEERVSELSRELTSTRTRTRRIERQINRLILA